MSGSLSLSRNRNYRILWGSQVLSEVGFNASLIALPLLVLAVTGSAAASGLVLAADALAQLIAGLPAGALVDRWDRRKVMLGCEAIQSLALASLVGALWWDVASVSHMVAVAIVMGVCRALFEPAEDACLPTVVPDEQLATAVALNTGRSAVGQMAGTAAGGFLFAIGRWVPFALDVLTHAVAFVALLFLRVPPRTVAARPIRHLGREIGAGLRWVWSRREVRVTALCAVALNLFFNAFYLVVIVLAQSRGVPAGEIGVMAAMLGVGGILGALLAPFLIKRLSPYLSIIGVFWALAALTPLAAALDSGYLLGLLFAGMALLAPTANTTILTHQLLLTPDELRGRLSGVMSVVAGTAAALGPALGGVLAGLVSPTQAVLACAAGLTFVAVLVTVNPTLRRYPREITQREEVSAP
ncbi:MFS transporter [Actinophytocola sp.]|uniref:MFS transporter n=1 Tax=Actinophytocola sp. TaxID=1872138 RepID=UPI002D7E88A1|nr:MFS transporter [Actinophytocola sp.]HET9143787.1 MFS transporter [Actinophytocola sp.]